jgi:hypothetical protein
MMNLGLWDPRELLSLREVAQLRKPSLGTHAALYARIRRGTLFAVKIDGVWHIPRVEIRRLQRQIKARKQRRAARIGLYLPNDENQALVASLTIPKRGRAALEAQAFLRGTIRARLRRMYPELDSRGITLKYWEEVATHG